MLLGGKKIQEVSITVSCFLITELLKIYSRLNVDSSKTSFLRFSLYFGSIKRTRYSEDIFISGFEDKVRFA